MKATLLHHLGAPCVVKIRTSDPQEPLSYGDKIYYLNPSAIFRHEPGGAVITPPMLYSSFIWIDKDLEGLLEKGYVYAKELPESVISLLSINNVFLENRREGRRLEMSVAVDGLPTQVLLDVTGKCNCDCSACYHKSDLDNYDPTIEDIISRVRKLKELGLCLFEITGGEPFLREDLVEILTLIRELGMHFYVVTNGEYLSKINSELVSLLREGLGLAISLDGIGEVHDRLRQRPGLYDKLISGVNFAFEQGIKFYFISTLNRWNIQCVPEMIVLAEKYNTTLHIRPTIRAGGGEGVNFGATDIAKALKQYLNHPHVRNGLLNTKKSIPEARYYGCGIRKRISVSPRGILFPCVMDRGRALVNIEKLDQKSLYLLLREETISYLRSSSVCRVCRINGIEDPVCGGFCRFSKSYSKER